MATTGTTVTTTWRSEKVVGGRRGGDGTSRSWLTSRIVPGVVALLVLSACVDDIEAPPPLSEQLEGQLSDDDGSGAGDDGR